MALTKAGMSAALKTAIESAFGASDDPATLQKFCDAIAEGVVNNIKADAVVNSTGADPQGGTVTSTGTIT